MKVLAIKLISQSSISCPAAQIKHVLNIINEDEKDLKKNALLRKRFRALCYLS